MGVLGVEICSRRISVKHIIVASTCFGGAYTDFWLVR